MHTVQLLLKTSKYERHEIDRRFRALAHLHNVCVKHARKCMIRLQHDKRYAELRQLYNELVKKEKMSKEEKSQKKKLASTTILSLLTRLESKNFVEVTKQGKLNLYTPLVSQSDYQAHESQSVLEKLYGNSLKKFVTSLYQGKRISSEEIHELSDFLKELEDGEE